MKLISDDYSIRSIREEDLKMLLSWRNSERIRSVMLTDHEITWEEHYNWFKRNKHNDPPRNLIFEYKGTPIGYIGYTEYDIEKKSCSPGAYLGEFEQYLPVDAGIVLFVTAIDYAFNVLDMEVLKTEVFKKNKKVLKTDLFFGYKIIGDHKLKKDSKIEDIYTLKMVKSDWDLSKFA